MNQSDDDVRHLNHARPDPAGAAPHRRLWRRWAVVLVVSAVAAALGIVAAPAAEADTNRVEITNLRTGLKADVMWASQAALTGVFLWPDNQSASQEFDLLDSGGGWFRIRARHSQQCLMLDWQTGSYVNGTRILQHPYCGAGYSPSEWRRGWVSPAPSCSGDICTSTSVSYPVLVNRRTGRCLDAASGGVPAVQAVLQQWDCVSTSSAWNAGNQLWGIAPPGKQEGYL